MATFLVHMRALALILLATAATAGLRPFVETTIGLPEAVDFRIGAEEGPFGLALGPGLPVLAWSKLFRDDSITPTAWNPSLTAYAHFGSGRWSLGPEAQILYFYGETDEYVGSCCHSARWRLDEVFLKQSVAVRWSARDWYAQAAPGWAEGKPLPIGIEGESSLAPPRHGWEYHPAFSLSFGRRF